MIRLMSERAGAALGLLAAVLFAVSGVRAATAGRDPRPALAALWLALALGALALAVVLWRRARR